MTPGFRQGPESLQNTFQVWIDLTPHLRGGLELRLGLVWSQAEIYLQSYPWCPSPSVALPHTAVPTALPSCTMGMLIPVSIVTVGWDLFALDAPKIAPPPHPRVCELAFVAASGGRRLTSRYLPRLPRLREVSMSGSVSPYLRVTLSA